MSLARDISDVLVPLAVRDVMQTPARTITPGSPTVGAATRLRDCGIGSLADVDGDDGECVVEGDAAVITDSIPDSE